MALHERTVGKQLVALGFHRLSLGQQISDIAQTRGKPMIGPDDIGDDGSKETEALQARLLDLADHEWSLSMNQGNVNNLTMPF